MPSSDGYVEDTARGFETGNGQVVLILNPVQLVHRDGAVAPQGTVATEAAPLPQCQLQWGSRKYSRRAYRAICDIPVDISKEELDRRLRVFGGNHWGMAPAINLHGVEFRAVAG